MKLSAKKPSTKKEQTDNREIPRNTIAALILTTLLIGMATFFAYQSTVVTPSQEQLKTELKRLATQQASSINKALTDEQNNIDRIAEYLSLLPSIRQVGAALPESAHQDITDYVGKKLDNVSQIRLIDAQGKSLLKGSNLSFVELDQFHRARSQEKLTPDTIKIENNWQLIAAANVLSPMEEPRVLVVTYSANSIANRIESANSELVQTTLARKAGRQFVPVFSFGTGGTPYKEVVKQDDIWQITVTASNRLITNSQVSPIWVIVAAAISTIFLLSLVYVVMGRFDPARQAARLTEAQKEAQSKASLKAGSEDILDISDSEIEESLGLTDDEMAGPGDTEQIAPEATLPEDFPHHIFRAYDIRGKVPDELTPDLARDIGRAIGSEMVSVGQRSTYVGRDGRSHSQGLYEAVIDGLKEAGCSILELGEIPTPLMYFAIGQLDESSSGVMVTASHNSKEYNGFKVVINGDTLRDEAITSLKTRIAEQHYTSSDQSPEQTVIEDLEATYIDRIFSDVVLAGELKVVVDAGNGVSGPIAIKLLEELGCEVVPLFCEIDGEFPNHDPDPTKAENLQPLQQTIKEESADLGIALDGDGDRLVALTSAGEIIWPDRLLMLFAKDVVTRNPGTDVVFDVKSTRLLNAIISDYGGRPIIWKTGHSHMKSKMRETGALLGGEFSGHIFFKERWHGMDDGVYAAARLLEIITLRDQPFEDIMASMEQLPSTPEITIPVDDTRKFSLIEEIRQRASFADNRLIDIDGIRVEFEEGWGLIRASNTSAALTLRFEAESEEKLAEIQSLFKTELLKIDDSLAIPF